jgi:hypothetical protein
MIDLARRNDGAIWMANAIESRGDLVALLKRLRGRKPSQLRVDYFSGAAGQLVETYLLLRSNGLIPRYQDKKLDAFMHQENFDLLSVLNKEANTNDADFSKHLSLICGAVSQFKGNINIEFSIKEDHIK